MNIISIDSSQAPDKCEYCDKSSDDLRPYGKNGQWICFSCGMDNMGDTNATFDDVLNGKGDDIKVTKLSEALYINESADSERALAIDFDGVIHSYTSGYQDSTFDPPVPGAIEALSKLAAEYDKIWIFTARDILAPVEDWMKDEFEKAELDYPENLEYTNVKPPVDIYIDDKGYQFTGDWSKTLEDLKVYKTWMNENKLIQPLNEVANLLSKKG